MRLLRKIFGFILVMIPFAGILIYATIRAGIILTLLAVVITVIIWVCVYVGVVMLNDL